jgi:hypothetical protein
MSTEEGVTKGTVRTGYVSAGGYAYKVRKVLYAQLKHLVQTGKVDTKEVARAAGYLNTLLYHLVVEQMGFSKSDALRITVNYSVRNGMIEWDLDSLKVEMFKRVEDEQVSKALSLAKKAIESQYPEEEGPATD